MAINGKKPPLEEGMVLVMEDGSQRKIISWTPGAQGEVRCKTRRSNTGRWSTVPSTIRRRDFWRDVDRVKD